MDHISECSSSTHRHLYQCNKLWYQKWQFQCCDTVYICVDFDSIECICSYESCVTGSK